MFCMAWSIDRHKFQITDDDLFRILRDFELILFNGQKLTPKFSHPISVNAGGAGDELPGHPVPGLARRAYPAGGGAAL